jgi:hypothetical protein
MLQVKYNVEVSQSKVKVGPNGSSQLGVIACKLFSQDEYVCDWRWDTQTGDDCTSTLVSADEQCQMIGSC